MAPIRPVAARPLRAAGFHDYSVHPGAIGRRIEVHADLDRVWVSWDGAIVADHQRVWAKHQTITDPEHAAAARLLRHGRGDLLRPVPTAATGAQVEIRQLSSYDNALGLVDGEAI